jgi:signal transduction histidine kinase
LNSPTRITHRQFEQTYGDVVRYIDETGLPVLDQQNQAAGWLLVWRDVTEERKLDNFRQELTGMIVHDLRNPITSVISGLTMLQEFMLSGEMDADVFTEVIEVARHSSESMLNLVESLLDISRFEQDRVALDCQELPLDVVIDAASRTVFSLLVSANIALNIDVMPDLPPVWIDAEQIQRVLVNLLDNALRFTPVDGEIRIEAELRSDAHNMLVRVVDTGPGIPPESRGHIFGKFAQLDRGPVRGHKGSGLGLTFCKLAVEAHGGSIWVEEGPEGGAAFCFTLPLVPAASPALDVS